MICAFENTLAFRYTEWVQYKSLIFAPKPSKINHCSLRRKTAPFTGCNSLLNRKLSCTCATS